MLDVLYLRKNELNKLFRMTNKGISFALKNDGKFLIKMKLKTLDSMKNWMACSTHFICFEYLIQTIIRL